MLISKESFFIWENIGVVQVQFVLFLVVFRFSQSGSCCFFFIYWQGVGIWWEEEGFEKLECRVENSLGLIVRGDQRYENGSRELDVLGIICIFFF